MLTAAPSAPSASPAGPGWVPALELSWLGRPVIRRDGQPASLATRKALALLAYLSLAPGPQPREALAALFWPEHDSPHALGNLRRALGALRDCLGAAWLEATNETVALGHGPTVITD